MDSYYYFCRISKGVPKTAEIKPIEPEQVMLLRDLSENIRYGQQINYS